MNEVKNLLTMKRIILLAAMLVFACMTANAQLIWEDRFEYAPDSKLEGQGGWELGTGKWTSGFSPKVVDRKIKYSGYAGSESGCIRIGGTGVNRLTYRTIDKEGLTKGALYVAMIVNLESVDGTRDFITLDAGTGDSPRVKIFVRKAGSGFSLGASASSPDEATFTPGLAFRTTHLVVMKYLFVEPEKGAKVDCNDKIVLYVNPLPDLAESKQLPVRFVAQRSEKAADIKDIKAINIRQSGVAGHICGMRVARSWNAAVKEN